VLWNAFPWHSFDPRRGLLRQSDAPTSLSKPPVCRYFTLSSIYFPCEEIVAPWQRRLPSQLKELNIEFHRVRHPASGGARLFRKGIGTVVKEVS